MTTTHTSMTNFIPECNITFKGGDLSSDTGSLLTLDFIFKNDLFAPFRNLPFADGRTYFKSSNSNDSLVQQITTRYLLGYDIQADQQVLKEDPILHQYFPIPSSASSVSRFFQRANEDTSNAFACAFMDQACGWINRHGGRDLIFDADSTKTDTYGNQEDAAWIHHYSQVGYHPFVINEYNSKVLAAAWLRPGSTYSADEAPALMNEVLSRIQDTYQDSTRCIKFRGDAAFFNHELMEMLETRENPVIYAIRAKGTGALNNVCQDAYYATDHKENSAYTSSAPFYRETEYLMTGCSQARRVCFKLFFAEEGQCAEGKPVQICLIPHIFAVITNDHESSVEEVINFYCQRGASENFTKELKSDFFGNTLSHSSFHANALEFFMKALAYNLFHFFQQLVLEGEDKTLTAGTFRKKYQKVVSRLSKHARKLYLRIAASFRYSKQFMRYLERSRTILC